MFGNFLYLMLGTLLALNECQSRAVNISNTWTLPQEGFSVFYRFFRDKISWFEADAVCQFHHANLVTVENGLQFDAARAFLKELDVTEFVWIGLMRPQDTQHFVWTNAKPLDKAAGYWADPFPVMESPLCAVIDPIRDFRWHALRCGGPETAAFLCEMEVPEWATECTIRSMPSLTVQYMSDSGTVELSRDCGEEGTRHMPCRGHEDHDAIANELNCIDASSSSTSSTTVTESTVPVTSMPMTKTSRDVSALTTEIPTSSSTTNRANSRFHEKTFDLQQIFAIDNAEDNNIDNHISQIETPAERHRSAKIFIDDIMMGDQPAIEMQGHSLDRAMVAKKIIRDNMPKKVLANDKWLKKQYTKVSFVKKNSDEEIMLGDQPMVDELKPLPHTKKSLAIDLKHHPETTGAPSTTVTPIASSTAETRLRRETEISPDEQNVTVTSGIVSTTAETPLNTVNVHPPKISSSFQKTHHSHGDDITAITVHDVKEKLDVHESTDHFIPPMLLVRTKFTTSSRSHSEIPILTTPKPEEVHAEQTTIGSIVTSTMQSVVAVSSTIENFHPLAATTTTELFTSRPTTLVPNAMTEEKVTEAAVVEEKVSEKVFNSMSTEQTSVPVTTTNSLTSANHAEEVISTDSTPAIAVDFPKFRQPHAPQRTAELHIRPSNNNDGATNAATWEVTYPSAASTNDTTSEDIKSTQETVASAAPSSSSLSVTSTISSLATDATTISSSPSSIVDATESNLSTALAGDISTVALANTETLVFTENNDKLNDFTNTNNFQPYRPNRRRALTKPETHNYMKKILG